MAKLVDLRELVSVSVCLAEAAGTIIRDVQRDRERNGARARNRNRGPHVGPRAPGFGGKKEYPPP